MPLRGHCAERTDRSRSRGVEGGGTGCHREDPGDVRREALGSLVEQLHSAQARISSWRRRFWLGTDPTRRAAGLRRSMASVSSPRRRWSRRSEMARSRAGRQLSAWLGLVPRQHSSGGKDRLGRISKRGDGYIRRLLVHRRAESKPGTRSYARRPTNSSEPASPGHCLPPSIVTMESGYKLGNDVETGLHPRSAKRGPFQLI